MLKCWDGTSIVRKVYENVEGWGTGPLKRCVVSGGKMWAKRSSTSWAPRLVWGRSFSLQKPAEKLMELACLAHF